MIGDGFIIFCGFVFIMIKLPRDVFLKVLGRPLATDIGVSVLAYMLHWGTFSGVMAAAVAGMFTSVFTSVMRKLIGYITPDGKRVIGML